MTIPAFLINLDRSRDRLNKMTARFSELGVAFERVKAVDGNTLSSDHINAVRLQVRGLLPLSESEVGCFLSHRKCWELIANGHQSYGCVFEDDVLLSDRLKLFLSDSQWIPGDADVVKLETAGDRIWLDTPVIDLAEGFKLGRLRSVHYRTAGYILSRRAAEHLLSVSQQFYVPVDLVVFDPAHGVANEMVIYQMVPSLCAQTKHLHSPGAVDHIETTIEERGRYEIEGKLAKHARKIRGEARKMWHRIRRRHRVTVGFDAP